MPAISVENIDQVTWLKTYPISSKDTWGDVVWSKNEAERLFVAGAVHNSDGSMSGLVRDWSLEYEDGQAYDWQTMDGKKISGIPIRSMALSPDGRRIALGSFASVVMIWDMDYQPAKDNVLYLEGHTEPTITAVAWSPDGKLLASGGVDKTVRLWNVDSEVVVHGSPIKEVMMFEATERVNCVSFSPNGKLLVIGTDGGVAAIDIAARTSVLDISGAPIAKLGKSLAWSSDGTRLAVGSSDGKVFIFTLAGDKFNSDAELLDISKAGWIGDLDFSPDGKMLVMAFPNIIEIWDIEQEAALTSFGNSGDLKFTSVAWSPDGRYIAMTYSDGTLRIIGVK